jgi:hypothetical protein
VQRIVHFQGAEKQLETIVADLFGLSLKDIVNKFRQ